MAFELAFQKSVLRKWRLVKIALNGAFLQKALLQKHAFIKAKASEKALKSLFQSHLKGLKFNKEFEFAM